MVTKAILMRVRLSPSAWAVCFLLGLIFAGCNAPGNGSDNTNDNGSAQVTFQPSSSRRAVAFVDPDGFEELLRVSETEPSGTIRPIIQEYMQIFAERFPNDAEFVFLTIDAHRRQLRFNAIGGFNITVRAPESGLGPFVSLPTFSTLPNLRSYIYLARKDSLVLGPALHELAHAWGVRLNMPPVLGEQANDSENHWGYSSVGGQMGGWLPGTLVDLGGGDFRLSSGNIEPAGRSFNTLPYSALEMYIMGLFPRDVVEPVEVAINPVFRSLFEFRADDIVTVTIEDIIAGNGVRFPSVENSPKSFGLTLIIITDHELSQDEWRFYEDSMDFFAATEDRDIRGAFPESSYNGQPIRSLIAEPDPEDTTRDFINFFTATRGLASVQFIDLPEPQ